MKLKDMIKPIKPEGSSNESSEIFRGSSDIDLAPEGILEAKKVASRTAGQFTHISSSPLRRALDTAHIVSKVNPKAGKVKTQTALEPWFLGQHEGRAVTPGRIGILNHHIDNPGKSLTGRGPKSTGDGESFNSFKNPLIGHNQSEISAFKSGQKRLNVTHYRDIHAVKSWLMSGAAPDKSIDTAFMKRKGTEEEKPGNMFHLDPKSLKLSQTDYADKDGIYLLRHGATAWNEKNRAVGSPSPNTGVSKKRLKDMVPVQL